MPLLKIILKFLLASIISKEHKNENVDLAFKLKKIYVLNFKHQKTITYFLNCLLIDIW